MERPGILEGAWIFSKKARPASGRRTRGFSLIELVIVALILLVLSTVGMVGYANLREGAEPRSASQLVAATLASARQNAIRSNTRYQSTFDLQTGEMWVDELDAGGSVSRRQVTNPEKLPDFMRFQSMTIEGVAQTARIASVRYWPDGHSDSASLYLVRFSNDPSVDANITTIKVFGPTGTTQSFIGQRR